MSIDEGRRGRSAEFRGNPVGERGSSEFDVESSRRAGSAAVSALSRGPALPVKLVLARRLEVQRKR